MLNLWRFLTFQIPSEPPKSTPDPGPIHIHPLVHGQRGLPSVRLEIIDGKVSIYGFLPYAQNSPYSGYLYLESPPPVVISSVLGLDWRSQLKPWNDFSNDSYIPILSDLSDEPQHCVRMKRFGAVHIVETWDLIGLHNPDWNSQEAQNQIMGWPAERGVWILRLRPRVVLDAEEQLESYQELIRNGGPDPSDYDIKEIRVRKALKSQTDMEGFCKVLEEAGAVFYEDPTKCLEVQKLGLLQPHIGRNDAVPPNKRDTCWTWSERYEGIP